MINKALPFQTVEQFCIQIEGVQSDLDTLLLTMPRQFHRYEKLSRNGKMRQIYSPGDALRRVQGPLQELLSRIPVSEAVHGWRQGCSPTTNARPHVGQEVVMKIDLDDFFPSCHFRRVHQLYLDLGCSEEVAGALTRLTTADYHLPQGFLTSPTVANLLLAEMDRRLAGLSRQRGLHYTRFGDDLAFSGPKATVKIEALVQQIVRESGYSINVKKFAEGGVRYASARQEICAITVNKKLNLRRPDYQGYRNLIYRCVLYGPVSEIHEGETLLHMRQRLQGCIHYVHGINPEAARQLQKEFDRIVWTLNPVASSCVG